MNENVFENFAPFIQEFIYKNRWQSLYDIQLQAADVLFHSNNNVIISSSTASGKSEAAFFPIITRLYSAPIQSIGVLYISPLKALINDQYTRIGELLKESGIPVIPWHGDISASNKRKLLTQPRGILQITPESLESMYIHHFDRLCELFGQLQYIVIDEIHSFIGTDRGLQVLSNIIKIEMQIKRSVCRIGLSATISDMQGAARWIGTGSSRKVSIVQEKNKVRKIRLFLDEYFGPKDIVEHGRTAFYEYLYKTSQNTRSIIFTNTRGEAEEITYHLKMIAKQRNEANIYYVHHSSLTTSMRNDIEAQLRNEIGHICIVATATLELGIDIGTLDTVFQINAPYSVSNLVQRMGRSGRITKISNMKVVCLSYIDPDGAPDFGNIPWDMIQAVAMIQQYIESRWNEPFYCKEKPLSFLYQQVMSAIVANNGMTPYKLRGFIRSLPMFEHITDEEIEKQVQYMLQTGQLEISEWGGEKEYIIGHNGERIVNHYSFYANILDMKEYTVYHKGNEIGRVNLTVEKGDTLVLAGVAWKVQSINHGNRTIYVVSTEGTFRKLWDGSGGSFHQEVAQRMRQVLDEDVVYPYMGEIARQTLFRSREIYRALGFHEQNLLSAEEGIYIYMPWLGSKQLSTLLFLMSLPDVESRLRYDHVMLEHKVGIKIKTRYELREKELLEAISEFALDDAYLLEYLDIKRDIKEKFDHQVEPSLLKIAYLKDYMDTETVYRWAQSRLQEIGFSGL